MRFVLVALVLFSGVAISDNHLPSSFESNYLLLEKKIEELKSKGQKINEDTRKEIDALLVQMNHEHTELKRELEKKDRQMREAVIDAKDTREDWIKRAKAAYTELSSGFSKAWEKLAKGED